MQQKEDPNQRYIINTIPSYNSQTFNPDINYQILAKILTELLKQYFSNIDPSSRISISSSQKKNQKLIDFYDGVGGSLYLLLKLVKFAKKLEIEPNIHLSIVNQLLDQEKLITMMNSVDQILWDEQEILKKNISFYFGYPGLLAIDAEKYYLLQDQSKFFKIIEEIIQFKKRIIEQQANQFQNEVLYGIAGFLQILLNLQTQFQYNDNMNINYQINFEEHVFDIVKLLLESGLKIYFTLHLDFSEEQMQEYAKTRIGFRLQYRFFKQEYLGAAHGLSGVLYMLIKALLLNQTGFDKYRKELKQKLLFYIKISINFLISCQLPSGNFPVTAVEHSDYLVQFCHGSPGVIPCLLAAQQLYFEEKDFVLKIQKSINSAVEHIWKYGILKKGFGLCHGISGTAYTFLQLYKSTYDSQYLYQAMQLVLTSYTDFSIQSAIKTYNHPDRFSIGQPDYPFGLMNGIAGDICFLIDLFNPLTSKFPGFEI